MIRLRYAAMSDVGPVRKNNQDSGYAGPHLLVVADGIGGQAAGDLASSLVVHTVRRLDAPAEDVLEALAGAVLRANDRLAEAIEDDPTVDGMGTTLTAVIVDADKVGLAHIGDSRGYLLRDEALTRLTTDHTFVQSLIDEGRITEEEAKTHPHRSLIMRALDGRHSVDADLQVLDLRPGDRLLLCSDGLSGYVDEPTMAAALGNGSIEDSTAELVRLALDARTTDNVTCVVGEIVDDEEAPAQDEPMLVGAAAAPPRQRTDPRTAEHPAVVVDDDDEDFDPEDVRYAPRSYRRFRWTRRLVLIGVLLLLAGLGINWLYGWSQDQYYVSESDGYVAIFRGLDQDVPGLTLSHLEDRTDLPVSDLPDFNQQQVADGIPADNLDDAEAKVTELRTLAEDCAQGGQATDAECEGAPEPSPTTPTQGNGGGGGGGNGGGGGGGNGGGGGGGGNGGGGGAR